MPFREEKERKSLSTKKEEKHLTTVMIPWYTRLHLMLGLRNASSHLALARFDLVTIDEGHCSGFGTRHEILDHFGTAIHLGMKVTHLLVFTWR